MITFKTNERLINAYIEQSVQLGKNNYNETLWFKGTSLYSYQSLLAIIEPLDKVLLIDDDIRQYSNTTAKQTHNLLHQAQNFRIYFIPLNKQPNEVLTFYWEQVEKLISKFDKARTLKSTYKQRINNTINEAESYRNYMQISKTTKEYKYLYQITKELFKRQIL